MTVSDRSILRCDGCNDDSPKNQCKVVPLILTKLLFSKVHEIQKFFLLLVGDLPRKNPGKTFLLGCKVGHGRSACT